LWWQRDVDDLITIDVKGLAGITNWPIDNLKEGKSKHFIGFVTFRGKIGDPNELPECYIVPSQEIAGDIIYRNPAQNRRVIPLRHARRDWQRFKENWELLR
jgi:hypothetical protein